jgi:hypothetical protein
MKDEPLPLTVVLLRAELRQLVDGGCPWHLAEDRFIGASAANAQLYGRALHDWAVVPKVVREG